jgi:hypothetical protein
MIWVPACAAMTKPVSAVDHRHTGVRATGRTPAALKDALRPDSERLQVAQEPRRFFE